MLSRKPVPKVEISLSVVVMQMEKRNEIRNQATIFFNPPQNPFVGGSSFFDLLFSVSRLEIRGFSALSV